ncbi:hypothetical protein GCM10010525_35050 [Glutamicibacter bergerei]
MAMSSVTDDHLARIYDQVLFVAPFFLIDAKNRLSSSMLKTRPTDPGVVAVGTVRPDAVAVDLDLDDADAAEWMINQLVQWCEDHAAWYLYRASGGGPGRVHFYALPNPLAMEDLHATIGRLRTAINASTRDVDVRSKLRLVAAPHRHGNARGPLTVSSEEMPGLLPQQPKLTPGKRTQKAYGTPAVSEQLTSGLRAVARMIPGGPDRSYTEFMIARRLKAEGATAEAVYNALVDPYLRSDIGHTAERGYAWFCKNMWSKIVVEARGSGGSARARRGHDWAKYALPTSKAVRAVWDTLDTRRKHTIEHVAVVAAARLGSLGAAGGPLPLRDLVEDTGRDIKTVQAALATLSRLGILKRVKSFKMTKNVSSSSDHYALTVDLPEEGSLIPTPRSYNPSDPLWLGLGSASLSLTLTTLHHGPQALPLADLLRASGFHFDHRPSTKQKQAALSLLEELKSRGVLEESAGKFSTKSTNNAITRPRVGLRRWTELRERHRIERRIFRDAIRDLYEAADSAKMRWILGRREALEKVKVKRRNHQISWWNSLPEAEREHRRKIWKDMWHSSDPEAQKARKRKLARERPRRNEWDLAA